MSNTPDPRLGAEQLVLREVPKTSQELAEIGTNICLSLGELSIKMASIERKPRYGTQGGRKENDAEHSYMLSLIAPELATALYPGQLNPYLVAAYSRVHDLVETKTEDGDTSTFNITPEERAQKEAAEGAALAALMPELPPHTRELVERYEQQSEPEARFTRKADKLMPPLVQVLRPIENAIMMEQDYDVTTIEQVTQGREGFEWFSKNVIPEFDLLDGVYRSLHNKWLDLFKQQRSLIENWVILEADGK